ncbi:MAG: DinB family protein [Candidatus Latescibacterota bacterium]|nr:MAG: DinB family protein [Candidatus Latescibacterota bacterium]
MSQKQEEDWRGVLARYVSIPRELDDALAGLSEAHLDLTRGPETWTIREIVHHIVDADALTKNMVMAALGNSGCTFELDWYDPTNTWARTLDYSHRPVESALQLLRANHAYLGELLEHLPDGHRRCVRSERFQRRGTQSLTVAELIDIQTRHATHHIGQIVSTRKQHKL